MEKQIKERNRPKTVTDIKLPLLTVLIIVVNFQSSHNIATHAKSLHLLAHKNIASQTASCTIGL